MKCSHGASIGQLDDEQLFYLRARGLDLDAARALLTVAFASEVLEQLPHARRCARRSSARCSAGCPGRESRAVSAVRPRSGAQAIPDPRAARARQAAGLPRQRGLESEAGLRDRGDRRLLPALPLERAPRRAHALRGGDGRVRARARARSRGFVGAPRRRARSCSCAARPKASTWSRRPGRGRDSRPGDEVLDHRARAPLEPGALADRLRADRRAARGRADRRARRRDRRGVRAQALDAHARGRARARLERARHGAAGRGARAPRAAASARSWSSTARRACRTSPSTCSALGCDFYAFSGHKMYAPTGIGVLCGRRRAARRDRAVAGRRLDDPQRDLREDRVRAARRSASRRARRTSTARSGSAWRSTGSSALDLDAVHAHEADLIALRDARGSARCPACA